MQIEHLKMLGLVVRDKVTNFEGVVSSVSFDLYGCIQVVITPKIDGEGKAVDGRWFDINRIDVIDDSPVMEAPNFSVGLIAEGKKGPAEKPAK